jgi:GLPGLI family protein
MLQQRLTVLIFLAWQLGNIFGTLGISNVPFLIKLFMKNFTFLLLLFCLFSMAQSKNITVQYGLALYDSPYGVSSSEFFNNMFINAKIDSRKLRFDLVITPKGSKFSHHEILASDSSIKSIGFTLGMAMYSGKVYIIDNKVYDGIEILGNNVYCLEETTQNWKITSETKQIGDYLCYKATNIYHVDNGLKVFNHPVTAWFCPKLPFPYGPNGYGNLPGLILELQVNNVVYGIKGIQFHDELALDLPDFSKCKVLDEKQLDEALKKFNGFDD